jgi:DNA-binding SARP family transcriptional activator
LGPVEVLVDGVYRPVTGVRRSAVLAALALEPGRVVSAERLVDLVWSGRPPGTATNTLQRHVSGLRELLGSRTAVLAQGTGYLLTQQDEALETADVTDLQAARRLLTAGQPGDLREALGLWRGPALSGLRGLDWFAAEADRVDDLRNQIELALVQARLADGDHEALVRELEGLSRERPLDEEAHRLLMLALYRCGRQAAALAVYRRVRQSLVDELGIDPNPALRDLEAAILRQDSALEVAARDPEPAAPGGTWVPVPAQLPRTIPVFAGREAQLTQLDQFLRDGQPLAAISGTAGIGKTTLAVHWAHQVAGQFPDGQLYVNLRGYDPGSTPLSADAAVVGFLEALGVRPEGVPATPDTRAALYRSLLAGRTMLVVVDNARDADHVRPLLPGSASCRVVVTSRRELTPLVAIEGARPVAVELLDRTEALELLLRRVGERRLAREPVAVEAILDHCAGLPLALSVAAARIASQASRPISALADELRQAALDTFDGGDPVTDVRAVLSWSYRQLSPAAAGLFRLLSVHPGPDFTLPVAASIAGSPVPVVRPLLTELTRAHLLTVRTSRYSHHAIMREYAYEVLLATDDDRTRTEAVRRVVDHYLHSVLAADRLMMPHRESVTPAPMAEDVAPEQPEDDFAAMDWFADEHEALLALVRDAYEAGLPAQAWQLAWALSTYLTRRGRWHDLVAAQEVALRAHEQIDDPNGASRTRGLIARGLIQLHRFEEAARHLRTALELVTDPVLHPYVELDLARALNLLDRPEEALVCAERAAGRFAEIDHPVGQARSFNAVGWYKVHCGRSAEALDDCARALALLEHVPDEAARALVMDTMGLALHRLGRLDEAIDWHGQGARLHRALGEENTEAWSLTHLGDVYRDSGRPEEARSCWERALEILDRHADPDADGVRERLRGP